MGFDPLLGLAAATAAAIAAIHLFLGGPSIARPLLHAGDLEPTPKYVNYYCWHLVSIVLVALAAAFALAAADPAQRPLAVAATALAAAFCLWGGALLWISGQRTAQMPQWTLFAALTLIGVWALAQGATA